MQENATNCWKIQKKYSKIIQKNNPTKKYRENGKSFNQPQSMQHKAKYTECHGIITFGNNTKSLLHVGGGKRKGGGRGGVARLYQIVGL